MFRPIPEFFNLLISHIIQFITCTEINEQKRDTSLFFKFSHKIHLVLMDILKRKRIGSAFLGIEADRDSLYRSDIIHGTYLIEISQRDMPAFLIDLNRCDGVGIFCIRASPVSVYLSFVWLINSSRVDPRSPLEFHVAIAYCSFLCFCLRIF